MARDQPAHLIQARGEQWICTGTVQILTTNELILCQRKALRVCALVNFTWSQSLVLGLKDSTAKNNDDYKPPILTELVKREMNYTEFAPGF